MHDLRHRPFSPDTVVVEALSTLPDTRSSLCWDAIHIVKDDPTLLPKALERRHRYPPPEGGRKVVTATTPTGFMVTLEALATAFGLPVDLTMRLAPEALLVKRGIWAP